MGKKMNANRVFAGKPKVKRTIGRPGRRWEVNIKLDLREIVWGVMGWVHAAQDRGHWRALVNTVINLRVPYNVRKFLSS
jgi:hypothetical protein